MNLDRLQAVLPAGVHAIMLTGRDVVSGADLAYPLLWADRTYRFCPGCGQSVDVDLSQDPPAMLDDGACQGGQAQPYSQQHNCGEWLHVDWTILAEDATDETVRNAAIRLANARNTTIDESLLKLQRSLQRDLDQAADRVRQPLADGETITDRLEEVRTGGETVPGIYVQTADFADDDLVGAELTAWAPHPVDEDAWPIFFSVPLTQLRADLATESTGTPPAAE